MTNFKRFLTLSLIATLAISAWAVPAYRGWRTVTQPDGSTVNIRQMGDEFFHYWENEEGQQVAKDEQGFWRVKETPAVQSEIAKQKQASRTYNRKAPDIQKAAGQINLAPRGLVILVNFSDVTYKSANTQSAMSDLMNSANYTYNSATGSVREFFKAQSNGQYVPDFDVVGPYTLAYNRAHYGANDSDGEDVLAGNMVVEACKAADADGVDFTSYNNDGDSNVDFVYIIYAGVGAADSDVDDAIWPHNWTLSGARYYNNCTYTKEQSKVDGLYIENYACSGELEGSATYRCPIGTIAHEFGHVLGLPDYYVTSSTATNEGKNYTPGAWHIMDYGSYNNKGRTPPNYSPHDKLYFGWYTINTSSSKFLASGAKVNGSLTTSYGSWYQITGTTSSASAKSTSRVWYLEDRQKSGWDKYLPGHGMVVWEVQYNSSNWTGNKPNNSTVGYTLVTANSQTRPYEPCVYNTTASSTSGTTFPGTSIVTSYSPATNCDLTEITESGGNITFKYNGGVNKTRASYEFVTDHCTAPADGDVAINAPLSVTITPDGGYTLDDASCWDVEMGGVALTYGTDFTYNASTNTFYIASLTDDIVIMAEAKLVRTVTWSVQGNTSTTTFADGAALVLPSNPSDCSGAGGKKFVGWTANSSVSGSAPADLFTSAGTKTVTGNITYYAVYATASGSGGSSDVASVIFANASSDGTADKSSSITDLVSSASGISSYSGSKVYAGTTGIKIGSGSATGSITLTLSSAADVKTVKVTAKKYGSDTGTLSVTAESTSIGSAQAPPASTGELTFTAESAVADATTITVATSSKRAYISSITVIADGGGTSYSDYSTTCTTCTNTPSMSFSPATVNKTTADASFTKVVSMSGNGPGQIAQYSSSDETVATVNNSGVVTLKGKVGTTTITAAVLASGNYCPASASYTLNVTAAPIDVTLYYNGTSANLTNQTNPYTLPTGTPYNTAMCSGDWTFAGWYSSAYSKSETAPTYITELTATGSAYAVYTTMESSGGGGSSEVASVTFSNASSDGTADKSSSITDLVSSASGISSYSGSKVYAGTTGIKIGSGSATGSITLTLSSAADVKTVKVTAKQYGSDTGTLSVTAGSTSIGSAQAPPASTGELTFTAESAVADATTITVATSSKRAYISSITVIADGGGSSTTYYATSPDCATGPTYTVTWKACGAVFKSETYAEGAALVLPNPAPEDNAGKSFYGWTETEHHTGASAPADAFTTAGSKTVTADVTYYAIYY